MKKLAILSLLTAITCGFGGEIDVDGPLKPEHLVYVSVSHSFDAQKYQNMDEHLIHFGIGSRSQGMHRYDVKSDISFNHNYLRNFIQVNYLFTPKEFFGGYIGLGVKGGVEIKKSERILNSHEPFALALQSEYGESYFPEERNVVTLERVWTHKLIADVPLVLGFNFEKENRHQFIQAEINKDLHVVLTSGIGF